MKVETRTPHTDLIAAIRTTAARNRQNVALARLISETPWGDIANSLLGVEIVLGLLVEATHGDSLLWDAESEAAGFRDEFDISCAELAAMSNRLRGGYIARQLRNLALELGMSTGFSGELGARRTDGNSLLHLIQQLVALADPAMSQEVRR